MKTKLIEIRDRCTCIEVLATQMTHELAEDMRNSMIWRCGYGPTGNLVILTKLEECESHHDPYQWGDCSRTMQEAHKFIQDHFDQIPDHWVVDVECILDEKKDSKIPECIQNKEIIRLEFADSEAATKFLDLTTDDLISATTMVTPVEFKITTAALKRLGMKFYDFSDGIVDIY